MIDFSDESVKKDCPHCDPKSYALKHILEETQKFWVVCDVHPLTEGHILIMPKQHISCIGEYNKVLFKEFVRLYKKVSKFIKNKYQFVSSFEHGKIGQTVFHSHVHLFPYTGKEEDIVPEGKNRLIKLHNLSELKKIFKKEGQFLFFSIENKLWIVDPALSGPRFFRDRFAKAIGNPKRGNWKLMHFNKEIMFKANQEIKRVKESWKNFFLIKTVN